MCGRYSASRPPDLTAETYAATVAGEPPPPSWNVAPTDAAPVVVTRDGRRELRTLRWGLIPSWADDPRIASRLINARAETVAEKPAFRTALVRRRCLVPADGWYEWRERRPHFVSRAEPIAFAGLYERRDDLVTFAIVTTAAAPDIAYLHDRMPVVLAPDAWDAWLDPAVDDAAEVCALLRPVEGFAAYEVNAAVGNVRADGPHLLEPVETLF